MKKIIISLLALSGLIIFQKNREASDFSNITLANIEALANGENPDEGEGELNPSSSPCYHDIFYSGDYYQRYEVKYCSGGKCKFMWVTSSSNMGMCRD